MAQNPPKLSQSTLSIIIPVHAKDEEHLKTLLPRIQNQGHEIIISREDSRAKALNIGATKASRKFLWFLHADSELESNAAEILQQSLAQKEEQLHYFKLAFSGTDSKLKLNALGANMRSKLFGAPFGDQGLALRKDLFFKIGGFPEDIAIGEDHLLVWHAKRYGIKLAQTPATITTSSAKYATNGWARTILLYQRIWISQAIPQALLAMRGR